MSQVNADTPMMRQFNALKADYPDCVLFFRAGDFYEMFGEDAVKAAEILQITLTTRNKNSENAVAMCGVPYHSYEGYLNRLTAAGVKVAIAEQTEDPAQAKGVVRREVVRVVTPGTTLSGEVIEDDRNHYLAAVEPRFASRPVGVALADLSTGQFEVAEFPPGASGVLEEFLLRLRPREVLLPESGTPGELERIEALQARLDERLRLVEDVPVAWERAPAVWFDKTRAERRLTDHFRVANLEGFGVGGLGTALRAAGALLAYLEHTQMCDLAHLTTLRPLHAEAGMWLDEATLANLEVFESANRGAKRHTLFAVLNRTRTPMGARLLRRWLSRPLVDAAAIEARLDAVVELRDEGPALEAFREVLGGVRDLERIVARISLPMVGIADVLALREALRAVQALPAFLAEFRAPLLKEIAGAFDPMTDVFGYLAERFLPEPALKLSEGGYIAEGVIPELDKLREVSRDSKAVISRLEADERKRTGIGSLKVRYNKVFGYYIEVSRIHQEKIPADYQRKQTLVNAERFTMPALDELEEQILNAEERIGELEYAEFQSVRGVLGGYARRLQETARHVAALDVLAALGRAAEENGYARPELIPAEAPPRVELRGSRHPVIERIDFDEPFIANDVTLDAEGPQILLLTGPNMAGKSTLMRQVALAALMAQAGSLVPAAGARLSVMDRIFTRVGASDNLARGQSTFMLEMNETANILNNATPRSLIVLDEIGRGTSTYDGISIAWAIAEQLHRLGALTLFATHYHELTQLARELSRLQNVNMAIQEFQDRLVFTRKLVSGEADRSYGVQVARLAGLPEAVVRRAHAVMDELLAGSDEVTVRDAAAAAAEGPHSAALVRQQLSFLADAHPVVESLREVDPDRLSPREALDLLYQLKGKVDEGGEL